MKSKSPFCDSGTDVGGIWSCWTAIPVLVLVTFYHSFGLYRFFDDWWFVYKAHETLAAGWPFGLLFHPLFQHWTPLWNLTEMVNYALVGWQSDTFMRTLIILTYIASLIIFLLLVRCLQIRRAGAMVGLLVFGLHPVLAVSLYSNCCEAQRVADMLVWVVALLALRRLPLLTDMQPVRGKEIACWLGLLLIALLFNERALSGLAILGWLVILALVGDRSRAFRLTGLTILAATFLLGLAFSAARALAGTPRQFGGAFQISPAHFPASAAVLTGSLLSPVPLLFWLDVLRTAPLQHLVRLGACCLLALAVLIFLACGLTWHWRAGGRNRLQLVMVSGALVLSWFPTALLAHVGEAYSNAGLIWFAILVALASDAWFNRARDVPWRRWVITTFLVIWISTLAVGLRSMLQEMRATGDRARVWLVLIRDALSPAPDGSFVIIDDGGPRKPAGDYGRYRLSRPRQLVLTGLRPWAVRWAVGDRLTAVLYEAMDHSDPDEPSYLFWREQLSQHCAAGTAYRLSLTDEHATLIRYNNADCHP
jgi:hypothetical protein